MGVEIYGILGVDFFWRFVVEIDYCWQFIMLYDLWEFVKFGKGFILVVVNFRKSKFYVFFEVVLWQGDISMLKLFFDIGVVFLLFINIDSDLGLVFFEWVIFSNFGVGLGGFLRGYQGKVFSLEILFY